MNAPLVPRPHTYPELATLLDEFGMDAEVVKGKLWVRFTPTELMEFARWLGLEHEHIASSVFMAAQGTTEVYWDV